jgi:hypothetical protein
MSKYTMYYNAKQKQYLDFATSWMKLTSEMNLTERQRRGMALFFRPIARRFGLIKEFRDIGVI